MHEAGDAHDDTTAADNSLAASASSDPAETPAPSTRAKRRAKAKQLPLWQETIVLLVVALVLAGLIKALFVQAFYIPSESMEPQFIKNDRILVEKWSYWGSGTPQRGDIVVFQDPGGWLPLGQDQPGNLFTKALSKVGLYPTGGHLVKRVIGVPGDVIKCCDAQGRLMINGVPIDESSYTKPGSTNLCAGPMIAGCRWTAGPVPPGHIFVMGDNRNRSSDSTVHLCTAMETDCVSGEEFVPIDLVVGKVFLLLWPRDRFTHISRPDEVFAGVPDGEESATP